MSLSVKEVAELLSIKEDTIHTWVVGGRIPYHRVGGEICFFSNELRDWAVSAGHKVKKEFKAHVSHDKGSLADAVRCGGIFYNPSGSTPEELIITLMNLIRLPEEADRETVMNKVLERERMGSTAIGSGIAVPHMHQSLGSLEHPIVVCGLLRQPVNWHGVPVSVIFLPCCPNMRVHLNLLMKIATLGKDPDRMRQLASCTVEEEVINLLEGDKR